jgi:DNA-binding transcriptional MerR regulator
MTTSDVTRPYLSIGEVLALLLEEFPDVTISKIRFLESQGLIDPERTPSGYRKFYDNDVERLRVILREQRENFLPLRVIRDRLENGQIDDSGPLSVPRGIRNVSFDDETHDAPRPDSDSVRTGNHPAARTQPPAALAAVPSEGRPSAPMSPSEMIAAMQEQPSFVDVSSNPSSSADVVEQFSSAEVCRRTGLSSGQLAELESFGLLPSRGRGANSLYSAEELAIADAAAGFMRRGVEARHLRAWRQAADREAALFEQMVLPLMRQRNPHARQQAATLLAELAELGGALRSGILAAALAQHLHL